jgi:chromosome segregation ATPase
MARASDTYTAPQAAKILDVSERRVRQLVAEGKLEGDRDAEGIMRLSQRSVNEERKLRRTKTKAAGARKASTRRSGTGSGGSVDVDQIAEKVATAVGTRLEGQLEITRQAESLIRQELDEERARRMEAESKLAAAEQQATELAQQAADLEQQVATLRTQLADLEAAQSKKRGIFRR